MKVWEILRYEELGKDLGLRSLVQVGSPNTQEIETGGFLVWGQPEKQTIWKGGIVIPGAADGTSGFGCQVLFDDLIP